MEQNITNSEYEELISKSININENKEKSIVDGKIVAIENDIVIVDVGLKSEGRIPLTEFTRPGQNPEVELGESLKVYIENVDNANGETKLSREKAIKQSAWNHLQECYNENKLVAGLYGVHIGGCFFGESMFSEITDTSKFCLLYLIAILKKNLFLTLDSQFYNEHLVQFGAFEISNEDYLARLKKNINYKRNFSFVEDFQEVLSLLQPNNHKL